MIAADIIRAFEREADPKVTSSTGSYVFYYSMIQGFDDYRAGRASTISGLQAPDEHTLVVKLTTPTGDLGYLLALPATAPIPPGAAEGHSDDGRFLVSTGPYMFEGSETLDFSKPAHDQKPVSGYVPFRYRPGSFTAGSIVLVRDPSWDPSTDPLRHAYVDRIEISLGGYDTKDFSAAAFTAGEEDLFKQVLQGRLDVVLDTSPPIGQLQEFESNPRTVPLVHENETSLTAYIEMNLAVPPLEDIHVRKAINLVIDKARLLARWLPDVSGQDIPEATGGGVVANHVGPDAIEGSLLSNYRPSWMASSGGNVLAAKAQMRLSRYDRNQDGICDASVCGHLKLVETSVWPRSFDPIVTDRSRQDRDRGRGGTGPTPDLLRLNRRTDHTGCAVGHGRCRLAQ